MDELRALRDLASEVHAFNSMSLEASELRDKLSQMKEAGAVESEAGTRAGRAPRPALVSAGWLLCSCQRPLPRKQPRHGAAARCGIGQAASGGTEQPDAASSMVEETALEEAEELEDGPSSFLVSEPEQRSVDDDTAASTAEPSGAGVSSASELLDDIASQAAEPSRSDTGPLSCCRDEAGDAPSSSNGSPYDAVLDAPRHTPAATTSSSERGCSSKLRGHAGPGRRSGNA